MYKKEGEERKRPARARFQCGRFPILTFFVVRRRNFRVKTNERMGGVASVVASRAQRRTQNAPRGAFTLYSYRMRQREKREIGEINYPIVFTPPVRNC